MDLECPVCGSKLDKPELHLGPGGIVIPGSGVIRFGPVALSVVRELISTRRPLSLQQLADRVYAYSSDTPVNEKASLKVIVHRIKKRLSPYGLRVVNTSMYGRGSQARYMIVGDFKNAKR